MSSSQVERRRVSEPEIVEPVFVEELTPAEAAERQAARLRLLWDKRHLLLRVTAVGLVVSILVAFLIPKSYVSTARLMPPDQQSGSGLAALAAMVTGSNGALGSLAGGLLDTKNTGDLFVGVLKSDTEEDAIIQRFDLKKVYGTRLLVDARQKLADNTEISTDRKSGIISIGVTDHNPQRAAAIANAYVDELNSLVAQLSTSAAHRERIFLEDRLKVVKQNLDDAAGALAQFSSKNSTLDIENEGKAMLDAAAGIAGELVAAQAQLEGLRQIYTDDNSRVKSLEARVAALQKQLEKLGGKPVGTSSNSTPSQASSDFSSAGNADSSGLPFPTIRNLPLLGAKYADYYQDAKIQQTIFALLTQQYELAKVQEAREIPSVKVLDAGEVPEKKSFPPRAILIAAGTFCAFLVAVVWIFIAERWRIADAHDPRKMLAHEVTMALKSQTRRLSARNRDTGNTDVSPFTERK